MTAPLTRRAALRGSVVALAGVGLCAPALARTASAPPAGPHPDAALIGLAGRVEALAARWGQAEGRACTLRDRVFVAERDRPQASMPPEPSSDIVTEQHESATEWVMVMRQPLVIDPAREAWRRARDDARAAKEQRTAAHGARLGLPALERRADRMQRRLHRWAGQLAETEAATAAGLSAKARAFLALGGGCRHAAEAALQDHPGLVLSIVSAVAKGTGGTHA